MILNSHLVTTIQEIGEQNLEKLVIDNPVYWNNERLGFSNRGVSPTLTLYEELDDGTLLIPRNAPIVTEGHQIIDERSKGFPVKFTSYINLRDEQKPAVDAVMAGGDGILQAGTGKGKGHTLDTIIYTPNGPVELKNLKKGSFVIGSNGKPTRVLDIYERGVIDTYKVTFSDGSWVYCDGEHLFTVITTKDKNKRNNRWQVKQVQELKNDLTYSGGRAKWIIPLVKPVEFEEQAINIDPYLLGVLIADGTLREKGMLTITNSEKDIIEKVNNIFPLKYKRNYDYDLKGGYLLKPLLRQYGLLGKKSHEKFIPHVYKYNTIDIRLKILQGLFDCDGDIVKSTLTYNTSSKRLALDVIEIVQSLGGVATLEERKNPKYTYNGETRIGRIAYRVKINLPHFNVFTSEKHKKRFVERTKYFPTRYLKNIEYVGKREIRCIRVEAEDSLYATKDFIITHNTVMACEVIARMGMTTMILVHKEFLLDQFTKELKKCLGLTDSDIGYCRGNPSTWTWKGRKVVIGMLQSLYTHKDNLPKDFLRYFGLVISDECHRVAAHTWARVITLFPCWKRLGLTATPKRADGLEIVFHFHLGPILYQLMGVNMKPTVYVVKTDVRETELGRITVRGEINISKLVTALAEHRERNMKILQLLFNAARAGRKIIVLSDRRGQAEFLKKSFDTNKELLGLGDIETRMYLGGMPQEERREAEENGDVLFATFQMAKEGLDIPRLDTLFLATPNSSAITVEQSLGRIARTSDDKKPPVVIDFIDANLSICHALFNKRMRVYKKMELEVK